MLWFPGSFLRSLQKKRPQIASWHRLWLKLGRYLIAFEPLRFEVAYENVPRGNVPPTKFFVPPTKSSQDFAGGTCQDFVAAGGTFMAYENVPLGNVPPTKSFVPPTKSLQDFVGGTFFHSSKNVPPTKTSMRAALMCLADKGTS